LPSLPAAKGKVIDKTGTDPRDFSDKFMPYYRHTELENGMQQQELVLFGLKAITPDVAMTYEIGYRYFLK